MTTLDKDSNIESIETAQTGGNVMVDYVQLKDGNVLAIGWDSVSLFPNMEEAKNPTGENEIAHFNLV